MGFTPHAWRRCHDDGRIDELIVTDPITVEIFVTFDHERFYLGYAPSLETAKTQLLLSVDDQHTCSRMCGRWQIIEG